MAFTTENQKEYNNIKKRYEGILGSLYAPGFLSEGERAEVEIAVENKLNKARDNAILAGLSGNGEKQEAALLKFEKNVEKLEVLYFKKLDQKKYLEKGYVKKLNDKFVEICLELREVGYITELHDAKLTEALASQNKANTLLVKLSKTKKEVSPDTVAASIKEFDDQVRSLERILSNRQAELSKKEATEPEIKRTVIVTHKPITTVYADAQKPIREDAPFKHQQQKTQVRQKFMNVLDEFKKSRETKTASSSLESLSSTPSSPGSPIITSRSTSPVSPVETEKPKRSPSKERPKK